MASFDLFREMENLRREVDDAFSHFRVGRLLTPDFLPGIGAGEYPRVNLSEDENNFYLEAMVPGIKPEQLELSMLQNTLTFSGERLEAHGKERIWHRHERGAGKFMRTIELPTSVDSEKIDAQYRNGVLMITLPKAAGVKAKKITVQAH